MYLLPFRRSKNQDTMRFTLLWKIADVEIHASATNLRRNSLAVEEDLDLFARHGHGQFVPAVVRQRHRDAGHSQRGRREAVAPLSVVKAEHIVTPRRLKLEEAEKRTLACKETL